MEQINEHYERQDDGTTVLIKSETITVPQEVIDQQIADKEKQLLDMYNDLQSMKAQKTLQA